MLYETSQSLKVLTASLLSAVRFSAPFSLRFIIQPMVAIILGVRDGASDAKAGAPPFAIDFLRHPDLRKKLALSASHSILLPFVVGIVLDGIVQFILFSRISLMQAFLVGSLFIAIPYITVRNFTNKIITHKKQEKHY